MVKSLDFPVAEIKVVRETRQRKDAEKDVEQLAASIESSGLINPIVIKECGELVAGERRLNAFRKLNREFIPVRIFEQLSESEATLIELQENMARRELTWQETAEAISKYHDLKITEFKGWTQMGTATNLGFSEKRVGEYILLAKELADPDVASCQTKAGAMNLLKGRAERAVAAARSRGHDLAYSVGKAVQLAGDKNENTKAVLDDFNPSAEPASEAVEEFDLTKLVEAGREAAKVMEETREQQKDESSADDVIINADFISWVEGYTGPKFDVLHVDFPYGKNYSGANTRRTGKAHVAPRYLDSEEVFWTLLETLLENQDKICYEVAHCIFWFDMQYYQPIIEAFESAGWKAVQPHPLIWCKKYDGIAADPHRRPRHCYENALLFSRGDRKLVRLDRDYFEMGVPQQKLHINQKPVEMLEFFLSMIVDEHTAVLDPTCGSGTSVAAAIKTGASFALGVEMDASNADVARFVVGDVIKGEGE